MANLFASAVNFNNVIIVKVSYPDGSVVPVDIFVRCKPHIQEVLGATSVKRCKLVMDSFYDWLSDAFEQSEKDCYPVNGSFVVNNLKTGQIRVFVANSGDAVHEQLMAGNVLEIVDSSTTEKINSIAAQKAQRSSEAYQKWQAIEADDHSAYCEPQTVSPAPKLPQWEAVRCVERDLFAVGDQDHLRKPVRLIQWKDGSKTEIVWEEDSNALTSALDFGATSNLLSDQTIEKLFGTRRRKKSSNQ